jgi:hypothetical protein
MGSVLELKRIRRMAMQFAAQLGVGEFVPNRAALVTAVAVWTTGFAIAGASAWRMHQATAATDPSAEAPDVAVAAPSEEPADTAEPEGVVYMPLDVVVGRRTPVTGVMSMQKP